MYSQKLLVKIINYSRHNEKVLAAREEQGTDKAAHPSTHTADRLGVMTGATIAPCPPITSSRQRNQKDFFLPISQRGADYPSASYTQVVTGDLTKLK